jgi:hypothetical protein
MLDTGYWMLDAGCWKESSRLSADYADFRRLKNYRLIKFKAQG